MEKPLQIVFKDMDTSEFVEAHVRERAERLGRFHSHLIGCRVVLFVPHRSPETGKPPLGISVEVEIPGHKPVIARNEEERREVKNDHLAVINRTFEAVERQLAQAAAVRQGQIKSHEASGEAGVVVRLFPGQNYGFIEIKGSPDLYFTRNAVVSGSFDALSVGTLVQITRATTEGPMGPQASSVRVLEANRSVA